MTKREKKGSESREERDTEKKRRKCSRREKKLKRAEGE